MTHNGKAIHFSEEDVRPVGRNSFGVKGIDLDKDDYVIDMGLDSAGEEVLIITENGFGKRTKLDEYRLQGRGGKGLITAKITEKNGRLADAKIVDKDMELMIITLDGIVIRVNVNEISTTGRNTMGVKIIDVKEGDKVVSVAKIESENELNENNKDNEEIDSEDNNSNIKTQENDKDDDDD